MSLKCELVPSSPEPMSCPKSEKCCVSPPGDRPVKLLMKTGETNDHERKCDGSNVGEGVRVTQRQWKLSGMEV